jgi:hypothetical protein
MAVRSKGWKVLQRITITAVVALVAAFTATAALAVTSSPVSPTSVTRTGGLHFVGSPTVTATLTNTSTFLTATGEVAGAGETATATLSATASVTRGCINRGSKDQRPSGLQRTVSTATGTQTFNTRSGRGTFNVSTTPITTANFTCPDQMVPVLVSVTYSNITLTVTSQTGTTTASYPNITLSNF